MRVNTDPEAIDDLLSRRVAEIFPNRAFLERRLLKGERVLLYLGIDPTGPTLHLGHAVQLLALRKFQELGHRVTLLIGDFTATIGDPTDKRAARARLSREDVHENAKKYKEQAAKIITFEGENPAQIRHNSEWLDRLTLEEALTLASHATVEQMLKRDMFATRIQKKEPIYLHEFLYPLLQGYDSVALDVDGEIGATDQTFNMLVGRTLLKQTKGKEKFVVTTKLLEDEGGKKMSKTEGNMIAFSDSEHDVYGKIMRWGDEMIGRGFELCTRVPTEEVRAIQKRLEDGESPREIKAALAREVTALLHGDESARAAEENFKKTFREGGVSEAARELRATKGERLMDVVVEGGIVASRAEFRRLAQGGAVRTHDGRPITDPLFVCEEACTVRIGKHRFVRILVV